MGGSGGGSAGDYCRSGARTMTAAMVVVQAGYAVMNVLSKLAMDSGMSPFVMIAYRQLVATAFLVPAALVAERKTRMKLSGSVLFQIFISSVCGATLNQLLYFLGLKYSSPTMACALNNLLPAVTFLMAVPFGMETAAMGTAAGKAKVGGTALCVGGSMLMTFYRGSLIDLWPSHIHWRYAERSTAAGGGDDDSGNMVIGAAFVVASCVAWSVWFIVQARTSRSFSSSPYTTSALICAMAAVQCLLVGAAVERRLSSWALGWDIRLAAVLFTGIVGSGLAMSVMTWCIERRGPLYVSMFNPLLLVIVAVLGWAVLDEKLYLGSVVGSSVIVGGLYLVLWGKGRECHRAVGGDEKGAAVAGEEEHGGMAVLEIGNVDGCIVVASPADGSGDRCRHLELTANEGAAVGGGDRCEV